jgi:hypothetical protein
MQKIPNHGGARLIISIQLTNLNLNHFKIVEAMGLKIIASRSP